jgi:hypothetical protein
MQGILDGNKNVSPEKIIKEPTKNKPQQSDHAKLHILALEQIRRQDPVHKWITV